MKIKNVLALGTVALFAVGTAHSQTLIENFNYTAGVLGTTAGTGSGESGNWGSTIAAGVVSGSAIGSAANYAFAAPTGYTNSVGANSYLAGGAASGNSLIKLSTPIDLSVTQTKYMSFFINLGTVTNTANSFAGAYLGTDAGGFNEFGFAKGSSGTTFGVQTSSGLATAGAPALTASTDYFVVLKLQTNVATTQDRLSAAIFTSSGNVTTEPGSFNIVSTSGAGSNSTLTNLALRNGSGQTSFRMDNVIIGDTWAAVTVPEPSTTVLLAGSLTGLMLLRRRRMR